jgi:hypothetical protein
MKTDPAKDARSALTELATMDRDALARRWVEIFKCPAPRHSHVGLLHSAIAWHCQMQQAAGAKAGGVERLIRSLRRTAASAPAASGSTVAPGTRLLREWRGLTHHVTVLAAGYEYNGTAYRSLTAIARQITGTAWSGPVFFGLRS